MNVGPAKDNFNFNFNYITMENKKYTLGTYPDKVGACSTSDYYNWRVPLINRFDDDAECLIEDDEFTELQFIQRHENGDFTAGITDEQLVQILLERQANWLEKWGENRFNNEAIAGLECFLNAQKERQDDRKKRGVRGQLKK